MNFNLNPVIEKFNRQDIKVRYGIFGSVLLAILLLDCFTLMGFQWGALRVMIHKNGEIRDNVKGVKTDLQRIDQIKSSLQNLRNQLGAVSMKIRSTAEVSAIIEDISRMSHETGVTINQIMPQRESQQLLMSTKDVKYFSLPVVIQANSGYHTFGHFINMLENGNLFFSLSRLTVEGNDNSPRSSINATLQVVLLEKSTDVQKK